MRSKLLGSVLEFFEQLFDAIPISVSFVSEIVAVSRTGVFQRVRAIEEQDLQIGGLESRGCLRPISVVVGLYIVRSVVHLQSAFG
jgi:hypothetical protein